MDKYFQKSYISSKLRLVLLLCAVQSFLHAFPPFFSPHNSSTSSCCAALWRCWGTTVRRGPCPFFRPEGPKLAHQLRRPQHQKQQLNQVQSVNPALEGLRQGNRNFKVSLNYIKIKHKSLILGVSAVILITVFFFILRQHRDKPLGYKNRLKNDKARPAFRKHKKRASQLKGTSIKIN